MAQAESYQTAVVLQGGGALGAYEYGVLKALYEARPGFTPAVVTGISIGAINAAILVAAKDDPIETLGEVWRNHFTQPEFLPQPVRAAFELFTGLQTGQYLSAFGNPGMYQVRPDFLWAPLLADSIYSTAPLRRTLEEVLDLEKLNRRDIHLVVGAIDVAKGELKDNYGFDNRKEPLSVEHIIASGSIPPSFPMVQIDGAYYWDGGLFLNTPLSPAINCLEQLDGDVLRELIVVELFPMEAPVPKDMLGVLNRLSQLLFTSKLNLDRKLFSKIGKLIRFIEKAAPHIPAELRSDEAYSEIFQKYKRIDALTVVTANFPPERANTGDFSQETIEWRIRAGYHDAKEQNIGQPRLVE